MITTLIQIDSKSNYRPIILHIMGESLTAHISKEIYDLVTRCGQFLEEKLNAAIEHEKQMTYYK